jgi:glutamate dehydrogenase/leucine dehydrogenase
MELQPRLSGVKVWRQLGPGVTECLTEDETSERRGISLRTAAFVVACKRILTAHEERGLYP